MNTTPQVEQYTAAGDLVSALWDFIENVGADDPERTEKFFALRARVREGSRRALPERVDLPSGEAVETLRFYFRGHYAGCVTAVVDVDGVRLALIGRRGGRKGYATTWRRVLEREASLATANTDGQ